MVSVPFPLSFPLPATIPITKGTAAKGHAALAFSNEGGPATTCDYELNGGSDFVLSTCSNGAAAGAQETATLVSLEVATSDGSVGGEIQLTLALGQPGAASCTALSVATGGAHTCSVRSGGTVTCAGYNSFGQLGDGTNTTRYNPVAVSGLPSAVAVTTGAAHSCALTSDGHVWCWGENTSGELGDGTKASRATAAPVKRIAGATAIAAGLDRTCALLGNGTIECWGDNTNGALGDGTTTNRVAPVPVQGITAAIAVAGGTDHTCALLADGSVACWGSNAHGALGDGTTQTRLSPVRVQGLAAPAQAIAAGNQYTCAALSTGDVACWGYNAHGDLGDGTTTDRLEPVLAQGVTTAVAVTAGLQHACALLAAGNIVCWGDNTNGDLGDGTTTDRFVPTPVVGLTQVQALAAGVDHTCAIQGGTSVWCWGDNQDGDLGVGGNNFRDVPVEDSPVPDYEVDVTGTPLNMVLDYPDPGSTIVTPHAVTSSTPVLNSVLNGTIPGLNTSLNVTPLGAIYNYLWAVAPAPGSTTQTLQQQSIPLIAGVVCGAVQSHSHNCGNVNVQVPTTGSLGALSGQPTAGPLNVNPPWPQTLQGMVLDYYLPGVQVTFDSDGGTSWKITFDIDVRFFTPYSVLPCAFLPAPAIAQIEGLNISPNNTAAGAVAFFEDDILVAVGDQSGDFFQAAGSQVPSTNAVDLTTIATMLNHFSTVCSSEEAPDGFTQFPISTDASTQTLNFTLTHPMDPAPVAYDRFGTAGTGSLFASLTANPAFPSSVQAGSQVTISGSGFPPNQATAVDLGWTDTTSGLLVESDVEWGMGVLGTSPLALPGVTGGAGYVFTGLQPSTTYVFEVAECDRIACTLFGPLLSVTTQSSAEQVSLALDDAANVLTSIYPDPLGNIATNLTIPPSTSAGLHNVIATCAACASSPSVPVNVVIQGQSAQPFLVLYYEGQIIGESGSAYPANVDIPSPVTIDGFDFPQGTVSITLDSLNGQVLGTASVTGNQFSAAIDYDGPAGDHTIIASETVGGTLYQASVNVNGQVTQ